MGYLKAIKDLRDPLSHPSMQEFSFDDSHHLLNCARLILGYLRLSQEAVEIQRLMRTLTDAPLAHVNQKKLLMAMPSEDSVYIDFVGRAPELVELSNWFHQPTNKQLLLAGDGGKGKSALAYNFAADTIRHHHEHIDAVMWLSAKKRRFQDGRTVSISNPDFADLDSALSWLLSQYGSTLVTDVLDKKRTEALNLLNEFPSLLVVDDIDSVLDETAVVEFFTFEAPTTQSRVLLTSRREIPGIRTLLVKGFSQEEAADFIKSRCQLLDLDSTMFSEATVAAVHHVTEGSPLYMDDLIRLTKVLPLDLAIRQWESRKGDDARKYALGREMERLPKDARRVLIAASISHSPISYAELEATLNISQDRLSNALAELQKLFLFPKPRIVETEQRYDINPNTKRLVNLVEEASDEYRRIDLDYRAVVGKLPSVGNSKIMPLIRQVQVNLLRQNFVEAERLLKEGLERYPNDTELISHLGWVYRKWDPFRVTDARECFHRVWQFNGANEETYKHWVKLEIDAEEWSEAIKVADRGLQKVRKNRNLLYLKGFSQVQLGRDLLRRVQYERSEKTLKDSLVTLKSGLESPDVELIRERPVKSEIHRTLVEAAELLQDTKILRSYLAEWEKAFPDDVYRIKTTKRLHVKFRALALA